LGPEAMTFTQSVPVAFLARQVPEHHVRVRPCQSGGDASPGQFRSPALVRTVIRKCCVVVLKVVAGAVHMTCLALPACLRWTCRRGCKQVGLDDRFEKLPCASRVSSLDLPYCVLHRQPTTRYHSWCGVWPEPERMQTGLDDKFEKLQKLHFCKSRYLGQTVRRASVTRKKEWRATGTHSTMTAVMPE